MSDDAKLIALEKKYQGDIEITFVVSKVKIDFSSII